MGAAEKPSWDLTNKGKMFGWENIREKKVKLINKDIINFVMRTKNLCIPSLLNSNIIRVSS